MSLQKFILVRYQTGCISASLPFEIARKVARGTEEAVMIGTIDTIMNYITSKNKYDKENEQEVYMSLLGGGSYIEENGVWSYFVIPLSNKPRQQMENKRLRRTSIMQGGVHGPFIVMHSIEFYDDTFYYDFSDRSTAEQCYKDLLQVITTAAIAEDTICLYQISGDTITELQSNRSSISIPQMIGDTTTKLQFNQSNMHSSQVVGGIDNM